ncbi:hypothetical protein BKA65DRAFT_582380 [Rhexocercosporidium sp. MPI-PUGE-AT-0058]|nr:hypothetical protein BKA65DRAFT_582380 [Rhexocercosporidium sp. MPI-PUGE-AT-0058]
MAAVYTAHPGTILTGKVIVGCSIFNLISYTGLISTYAILCAGEFPSQCFRSYTLGIATGVLSLDVLAGSQSSKLVFQHENLGYTCQGLVAFAAMRERSDIEKSGNEFVSAESKKNIAMVENSVDVKA